MMLPIRSFSVTARAQEETDTQTPAQTETAATSEAPKKTRKPLNPETVALPRKERKLIRETGQYPIGSRRRRRALQQSPNIPFAELPYQCFQEARKVLDEDRKQKLAQIELYRTRIAKLQDKVVVDEKEQAQRDHQLRSMRTKLEHTKILADINDPIVKKRFEDGLGMSDHIRVEGLAMLIYSSRRHEQAHLPPSSRPEMAPVRTQDSDPAS